MASTDTGSTADDLDSIKKREIIRQVWEGMVRRRPFERVTEKALANALPFKIERSTLYWHMTEIRRQHQPG